MIFRKWTIGTALLCAMLPIEGHALTESNFSARTTGDLIELCDPTSDSAVANAGVNFCHGFAQGAVSVEMQSQMTPRSVKLFCMPDPLPSRTETIHEFVVWARASADRTALTSTDGLMRFLGERFPCPKAR